MFRTYILFGILAIVVFAWIVFFKIREGCNPDEVQKVNKNVPRCCEDDNLCKEGKPGSLKNCSSDYTYCEKDPNYIPFNDPRLQEAIQSVTTSCTKAMMEAKLLNDTVENKTENRTNNYKAINDKYTSLITDFHQKFSSSERTFDKASKEELPKLQKECDDQYQKYQDWRKALDNLQEKPCKPEPPIENTNIPPLLNTTDRNVTAFSNMLDNLENRLKIIENNLLENEVTIDTGTSKSKYYELIIDHSDQQTFDFSLPDATPIVSIVGIKPQKLRFVLPQGQQGREGDKGMDGEDYKGLAISTGLRGLVGEPSYFSGLPEQWSSIVV